LGHVGSTAVGSGEFLYGVGHALFFAHEIQQYLNRMKRMRECAKLAVFY
jgi:hypothetical protein